MKDETKMLRVVIDTNIIVSALRSPDGNPAKILDLVTDRKLQVCFNIEILSEYIEVLGRPHFNFVEEDRDGFISGVKQFGLLIKPDTSDIHFPDEDDRSFYDTAKTSGAILITGNTKHYPSEPFIINAAEFLSLYRQITNPAENFDLLEKT